jgi:ATP-dependent Clp protease ATP-binding subunit ClpA
VLDSYSDRARRVVSVATQEARRLDHPQIGTEHLLLGLLSVDGGVAAAVLRNAGATLHAARHKVAEVVGNAEPVAGGAELPFTARAQRALERAGRFARQERVAQVCDEHVLLGVLDVEGLACQVLRGLDVDLTHLHDALAAPRADAPPALDERPAIEAVRPRCPSCRASLDDTLGATILPARHADEVTTQVTVVYCTACGASIGVMRG